MHGTLFVACETGLAKTWFKEPDFPWGEKKIGWVSSE